MRTELLDISVSYNERWPRNGYMFLPTFLLNKGDLIIFNWQPKTENRKLKIEIEETDSKADYSHNLKQIAVFEISNTEKFEIPKTGLYNFPIENPKESEYEIGKLTISRECNSLDDQKNSPFPERYYEYFLVKENSTYIKKCRDWGYKTDIGACIINDYVDTDELNLIFDSSKMNYHDETRTEDTITKTIYFTADKGDKIVVNSLMKKFEQFIVIVGVEKNGSIGLKGNLNNSSYFISNQNSIYKIETRIYRSIYGNQEVLPEDYIDLKIYRNSNSAAKEFDINYKLIKVFNEVYNRNELEPVEKASC